MISSSPGEGQINHYFGVRMRVNGIGNLQMRLISLDEKKSSILMPLDMFMKTNIEPFRKANFKQQRAQLEILITELGETFEISRIVLFMKPSGANYPG